MYIIWFLTQNYIYTKVVDNMNIIKQKLILIIQYSTITTKTFYPNKIEVKIAFSPNTYIINDSNIVFEFDFSCQ